MIRPDNTLHFVCSSHIVAPFRLIGMDFGDSNQTRKQYANQMLRFASHFRVLCTLIQLAIMDFGDLNQTRKLKCYQIYFKTKKGQIAIQYFFYITKIYRKKQNARYRIKFSETPARQENKSQFLDFLSIDLTRMLYKKNTPNVINRH